MRERDEGRGRVERYAGYFTGEYLMGPNSIYLLDELLSRYPLMLSANDDVLDLGCGKGLSSLFLAGETGRGFSPTTCGSARRTTCGDFRRGAWKDV